MIRLILQHGRCSGFVLYRRIEQDFIDQWQMICKIETEQWHCEWRGLRLLPSPPTACAGWENMVCLGYSAKQKNVFMLHGFFYSAQLSHLLSSVCVCSCRGWFNTEAAGKETAQAGKPKPSVWLLHTRVFKHSAWEHMPISHTTVSSVFIILWGE